MNILQIIPNFGLGTDGVTDYADMLASGFLVNYGLNTNIITCAINESKGAKNHHCSVIKIKSRTTNALLNVFSDVIRTDDETIVYLHYVNYGYQRRGIPFWLINGMEVLKSTYDNMYLITMFHELYAFSPPWRSAFWISPLQKYLAKKLFTISNLNLTSIDHTYQILEKWQPNHKNIIWKTPIFSTIGEPNEYKQWHIRKDQLIVFGRAGTAISIYEKHKEILKKMCNLLNIREIIDIGPRTNIVPSEITGIPVKIMGTLSNKDVSNYLQNSKYGLLREYPIKHLGKSSIFAAFSAHGVIPLVIDPIYSVNSTLHPNIHFINAYENQLEISSIQLEKISIQVNKWYEKHSLNNQVLKLYEYLCHISKN